MSKVGSAPITWRFLLRHHEAQVVGDVPFLNLEPVLPLKSAEHGMHRSDFDRFVKMTFDEFNKFSHHLGLVGLWPGLNLFRRDAAHTYRLAPLDRGPEKNLRKTPNRRWQEEGNFAERKSQGDVQVIQDLSKIPIAGSLPSMLVKRFDIGNRGVQRSKMKIQSTRHQSKVSLKESRNL